MNFSLEQISFLLQSVEINRIKGSERVPILYAGFRTESLVRIHLLPYVLPFKSYRHLAFVVAESPELQQIVGLDGRVTPSRATLWHFRKRNSKLFRCMLSRALALISVEAFQNGIHVQFFEQCNSVPEQDDCFDSFVDTRSAAKITTSIRPRVREEQLQLPLFASDEPQSYTHQKKIYIYDEIGLPMHVHWSNGSENLSLSVDEPSWSDYDDVVQDLGVILGRAGKSPYTACNVIVLNNQNNSMLLSERLVGTGKGTYSLPGGKMNEGESIWGCVVRELKEEVGIEFRNGYIVSERQTNYPGFPQVRSIGVLATEWGGELQNPEPHAHGKWEWYAFTDLPSPLFFPTECVLEDYLGGKFARRPLEDDLPFSAYWR